MIGIQGKRGNEAGTAHPADSRLILITGAGAGLGAGMARLFHAQGWTVAATDHDIGRVEALVDELGERAHALKLDVTMEDDWQGALSWLKSHFRALDVLVNNAGVAVAGRLERTPLEDWRWVMDIDLMGVVMGCHTLVPWMRETGRGHVINVASFAGLAGAPDIAAYGTAKAGVVALSEMLRAELFETGVAVSVLCPAFVKTRLTETMRAPDAAYQERVQRWMNRSDVSVEDVAQSVYRAVHRPRFLILTHRQTRWAWRLKRWFPELYFRALCRAGAKAPKRPRSSDG